MMSSTPELSQPKAKVLIGTPCYGGLCFVGYVASLLTSREYLKTKDIQIETCFLTNESLIPRGRNTIVAKFMADPSFTHLLFIDGDITFNHLSIEKLINHDKDIVGALYPKKGYDWKKLKTCTDIINSDNFERDISKLKARLMNYTVNYTQDRQVINGLLRVKHIGTGFMMIKRHVINKMMVQYPDLKYDDDINILNAEENNWLYALFDCEVHRLGKKRHYLSEDYLFCKRWQDMGGDIYADITIPLTHTGTHSFGGNYLMSINFEPNSFTATPQASQQAQQAQQAQSPGQSLLQQAEIARATAQSVLEQAQKLGVSKEAQAMLQQSMQQIQPDQPATIPPQDTSFNASQPDATPKPSQMSSDSPSLNVTPVALAPVPTQSQENTTKISPKDIGKIEIIG